MKYSELVNIISECIQKSLNESQQSLVDNFNLAANMIDLTDPDQFYYVQILKRWKDNKDKGMVKKTDGTYHGGAEYGNFSNGTAFKIRSAQELLQLKQKIIGLCDKENARAYITSNPRSDSAIQQFKPTYMSRFRDPNDPRRAHAEEILCGQSKFGDEWADERPRFFLDIDETDKRIWNISKLILSYFNIPIESEYTTPSGGLHVVIADRRLKNVKQAIYILRMFDGPLWRHIANGFNFGQDGSIPPQDENKIINVILKTQANGNTHCFPDRGLTQTVHANFDGKLILYSNVVTAGY